MVSSSEVTNGGYAKVGEEGFAVGAGTMVDPGATPYGVYSPEIGQRHRVQIDFSAEAYERLLRIRQKSGAQTNTEIVRNALRLYDWFLDQKATGSKVALLDQKGVMREIEIIF